MDWSNEHYIRIYTRDTTTWRRLGWDGQCVLQQMMRKLDMSGVLDIEDMEPWEAVVLHCQAPEDVARAGMAACLDRGVFVHNGTQLVAPNYIEAQHASKSDRQRQRESRERRRATAVEGTRSDRDEESRTNTERDVPSRDVTDSHDGSQAVRDGHKRSLNSNSNSKTKANAGARAREAPGGQAQESLWVLLAEVYRDETGRKDLGALPTDWSGEHRGHLRTIEQRCEGDPENLRAQLRVIRDGDERFMLRQPLRVWVERLGVSLDAGGKPGTPAPTSRAAPGPSPDEVARQWRPHPSLQRPPDGPEGKAP